MEKEQERTDVALLFEGMLLEGFRPEESYGLSWTCIDEEFEFFTISEAHKDFSIYNEFTEVIGHVREYDTLKTDGSVRKN